MTTATPSWHPVDMNGIELVTGQRVRVHCLEGVREGIVVKLFPDNRTIDQPGCWVDINIEGQGPEGIPSYILEVIEAPVTPNDAAYSHFPEPKNKMVPNCCENDITPNRYAALMNGDEKLTEAERTAGWHFCPEWDFLLIHKECSAEECSCDLARPLPSASDNPNGLHQKYIITRADGEPVDPKAVYFVLRLDGDHAHNQASRVAALKWADVIDQTCEKLGPVANDLRGLVNQLTPNFAPPVVPKTRTVTLWEYSVTTSGIIKTLWSEEPFVRFRSRCYATGRACQTEVPE